MDNLVTIIACEADWPPAYRVNRWVKDTSSTIEDANDALSEFTRFPSWMWRNTVIVDFITWLRQYNSNQPNESKKKVGFFGLDIYSLQSSREEVLDYLETNAPDLLKMARRNYGCFDKYADEHEYGVCAGTNLTSKCEKEAIRVLKKMLERHAKLISENTSDQTAMDESFFAMENAKIVHNAEKYYRHMFDGGQITWNIRDTHMCDCLQDLIKHYGPGTKAVVWAHNSHVGDGREREAKQGQKITIGQLVRERFGIENTYSIGFTTYTGTVTAADNWDMDPDFKRIRPSLPESIEYLFHDALINHTIMKNDGQYFLIFRSNNSSIEPSKELNEELYKKRLERAIRDHSKMTLSLFVALGVIYRPHTERQSHYFNASVSTQFDCIIHIETTRALRPLEIHPEWADAEKEHVPDTFPMNV